jgi:4-amino-4-deoxy-L-arabinose transferase-like glycosyltransferase
VLSSLNNKAYFGRQQNWLSDILGLSILLGLFYALWIGSHALFTPDEGRYSEVAREMVVSGDYITPRLNGVAFLDKPVLYYWLQASAIQLFGLKEWALRFWPALIGVLSTIVLYGTGRLLFNRRTGLIAALLLATSPLYYGGAHYADLDLEVAALIADSLLCFIAAMQPGLSANLKKWLLISAYIFAGTAGLTKGLIGIAFPAMIIGSWILILQRWRVLLNMRLLTGMIIFLVITLPWYVLVQKANPEFLHFFFVTQQVSRFLTTQAFNSKAPDWFYVPVVMAGFFPWTLFLFQALAEKIRLVWNNRQQHAAECFLLLWFFIVFIFFSFPRSKTIGYILPLFPAMALLTASYLNNMWGKNVLAARALFGITCAVLGAGFYIVTAFPVLNIQPEVFPMLHFMGMILLAAAVINCLALLRNNFQTLIISMLVISCTLLLAFVANVDKINDKSAKPIALNLKTLLQPDDEVVAFYKYYQDLPIYLERKITIVADWHAPDIQDNDNWLREMWYGMAFQDTNQWLIERDTFWQRWNSDKRLYVVTDADNYKELAAQTHVYKIMQHKDIVLLSNKPDFMTELKVKNKITTS